MPAIPAFLLRRAWRGSKADFAKRASGFVKSARGLPGFPLLWIACAGVAGLMIITGGFRTDRFSLPQRMGFWLLLMGWNALKWQVLFALFVRTRRDWARVAGCGVVLLALPLPIEIAWSAAAVGGRAATTPAIIWARAAAIGLMVLALCMVAARALPASAPRRDTSGGAEDVEGMHSGSPPSPDPRSRPAVTVDGGLLARARVPPAALLAIEAEDHYCRVRARQGGGLHHYRFGDALAEVAALDGAQIHRGTWVAAEAVAGARRDGRRWLLRLADGHEVPVSAPYQREARRRGWLPPRR